MIRIDLVCRRGAGVVMAAGMTALTAAFVGCASPEPVRVVESDARRDVEFYERVVADDPENEYARARLAEAKQRLARHLAWDADAALARGRPHEGLRLAREAVKYDSRHADILEEASRRVAAIHLREAERALANYDFDASRAQHQEAGRAAPTYLPVQRFEERLDAVAADFHRELAQEFYEAKDYEEALVAISRAAALQPHDAQIVALQMRIERASRSGTLARRMDEIRQMVLAGRLDEAELRIDPLLETDPNDVEARALRARVDEQRRQASEAVRNADIAMNDGRFGDAAELLLLAMELDQSVDASVPLMEARGGMAREQMVAAMESGDRLAALLAAREALRFVQSEEISRLVPQLETAYVQQVRTEARAMIAEGRNDEARKKMQEAMEYVESEELRQSLEEMNAGNAV